MYKKRNAIVYTLEDCQDLLIDHIDPCAELIRMADLIDWSFIETIYAGKFKKKGKAALPARMAFGLLLLKHQTRLSSTQLLQETLVQPAWQYFLGYPVLQSRLPLTPSVVSKFAARFTCEDLAAIVEHQILFPQSPSQRCQALPARGKPPINWHKTRLPKPEPAAELLSILQEARLLAQKSDTPALRRDWFVLFSRVVQQQAQDPGLMAAPVLSNQTCPPPPCTSSRTPAAPKEQPPALTSLKGETYVQSSLW